MYHCQFKHALEECRMNNLMPFSDSAVIVPYLRNMQEPCLTPSLLSLEQGVSKEWSNITTLEAMQHSKVKKYLKAYLSLTPSISKVKQRRSQRTTEPACLKKTKHTRSESTASWEACVAMTRIRSPNIC